MPLWLAQDGKPFLLPFNQCVTQSTQNCRGCMLADQVMVPTLLYTSARLCGFCRSLLQQYVSGLWDTQPAVVASEGTAEPSDHIAAEVLAEACCTLLSCTDSSHRQPGKLLRCTAAASRICIACQTTHCSPCIDALCRMVVALNQ